MAFSLVQSASSNGEGPSSPITVSFTSTPVQGDLIIASCNITSLSSGFGTISSTCTDGNSNSMTLIANQYSYQEANNTYAQIVLYAYVAGASQSESFTFNPDDGNSWLNIYEFSGNYAATNGTALSFLDVAVAQGTAATLGNTATYNNAPSLSTTNAADLIFTMVGWNGTGGTSFSISDTAGHSYTDGFVNETSGGRYFDGYGIATSTGTYNPTFTITAGNNYPAASGLALITAAFLPEIPPVATIAWIT